MSDDALVVASVYEAYFTCRSDAYSIPITGAKGWRVAEDADGNRLPLTPQVLLDGLTRKGPPVSGYMLRPDNTTHVFAVDFDTADGLQQAMRLADAMANEAVPAYVVPSRRGAHLWCVGMDRLPAKVIRRAVRSWIKDAGFGDCPGSGQPAILHPKAGEGKTSKPAVCPACFMGLERLKVGQRVEVHPDPKIEIRPGQDEIYPDDQGRDGLGTCLRLPMMPHPVTGKRGSMVGVGGEKLGDSIREILLEIDFAKSAAIEAAAARWVQKIKPDDVPRSYRRQREALPDDLSASAILAEFYGIHNARPGRAVRCTRHDDRVASLSILRDDQRVICRGGGCELNNNGHGRGTVELLRLAGQEVPA